jgi:hypothetical protein
VENKSNEHKRHGVKMKHCNVCKEGRKGEERMKVNKKKKR